jgi:hypothetical protein
VFSFAFTPGAFVVSPAEVDLGTVRVLPGSPAGPYAFSISVVGGPVPDPVVDSKNEEEIEAEIADFSASWDAAWLTLEPANGTIPGSITATATVSETMGSGLWTANVTIFSGLAPATELVTIPVTINVIRSIGDLLTVSPLTFPSQRLQVFGFEPGWTAASDMGFVSAALYNAEGDSGTVIITDPYGWVEESPNAEILSAMDYGTYIGYIKVSDLDKEAQFQIPITINIREPGDAVYLPVVDFISSYSQMDAAESSLINVQIPVSEDIAHYPTATTCQAAGGTWIDPNNTLLDSLDAYCSLNERAYVLLERRDMEPGMVYAMTKTGTLALAYENGIKVSGADDLSYADGPVSYIPVGPLQMIGSYGTVVVSLRIGNNLSSAVEIQRLLISLQTLEGQWTVTEAYKGSYSVYDFAPLTVERIIDGQPGYTASWENMPVRVSFGDGSNWLYQLFFEQEGGIYYTYQIQRLSGSQMSGQWRYTWR